MEETQALAIPTNDVPAPAQAVHWLQRVSEDTQRLVSALPDYADEELLACRAEAEAIIGRLSDRDLRMFVLGLYAGEGSKTGGSVSMANTNPVFLRVFITWLRREFVVDEPRLRVKLYLHEGLDLETSTTHWSRVLGVPEGQFRQPYRAKSDPSRRRAKHIHGCATVLYSCTTTHRRVMAMIEAITFPFAIRDSSVGRAGHC